MIYSLGVPVSREGFDSESEKLEHLKLRFAKGFSRDLADNIKIDKYAELDATDEDFYRGQVAIMTVEDYIEMADKAEKFDRLKAEKFYRLLESLQKYKP